MIRRMAVGVLSVGMGAVLAGCFLVAAAVVGGAIVAGAFVYAEGKLSRDYNATLDRCYEASLKVAQAHGLKIEEKTKDAWTGIVRCKTADQTSVSIECSKVDDKKTTIGIRFGATGDQPKSEELHQAIAKELSN